MHCIFILETPLIKVNFCRYYLPSVRAVNTMKGPCELRCSYFQYTIFPLSLHLRLSNLCQPSCLIMNMYHCYWGEVEPGATFPFNVHMCLWVGFAGLLGGLSVTEGKWRVERDVGGWRRVSRWWLQEATANVCVYAWTRLYVCLGSKWIHDTHVEQLMQALPMME